MRYFQFIIFMVLTFTFLNVFAATATPTTYKTTVTKVELCTSSDCSDPVVVGSTTKTFNIASATIGGDVGNYINDFTLTLGKTYSHMRTTINTTFKIKGTVDVSGTTCNTVESPTVAAASATATAKTVKDGTIAEMDWVVPDANGGGDYSDLTSTYSTNGISKTDGASTFTFTVAMTSSYTPKATDSPKIRMSFDVANTLIATTSGTTCIMYIDPPVQAVSIYN